MATAVIIGIIIVICIIAVISYVKKLAHGCCGAGGDSEKKIKAKSVDLSEYNYKYIADISGMTCKNCSTRIENRFNKQDGIHAIVSHKDGKAEIYSVCETDEILIRQIIIGLGYTVNAIHKVK